MAKFFLGAEEFGSSEAIDFAEFIQLAMGQSIVSGADWGGGRVELGLSGNVMLRIKWVPDGVHLRIFSTTNKGETPPLMLALPEQERRLPLREVERRLRALRTLHAAVHLLQTGRGDLLEKALAGHETELDADLESDEQLFLESLSPGSWVLTLWAKARESYRSLLSVIGIVYSRGREAFLSKLEAEARLKQLDVEEREFKLSAEKLDYSLGLAAKLHNPESQARLRAIVEDQVRLLLPDSQQNDVQTATGHFLEEPLPRGTK